MVPKQCPNKCLYYYLKNKIIYGKRKNKKFNY